MVAAKKPKVEPQHCPRCKSPAVVENKKPRYWQVVCSKNTGPLGSHWAIGHPMFTRHDAIVAWNKLDENLRAASEQS